MRILWCGDSPTVSTGFSRCTVAACAELHNAGHEVHVLGMSYFGDPHEFPYAIYPCVQPLDGGRDAFGVGRMAVLAKRLKPDLIVILQDPWNIEAYIETMKAAGVDPMPPVVGWLAVDGKNQRGKPLNSLAHVVTWTQFGIDELRTGGYEGPASIVPLGVDTSIFYSRDRKEARRAAGIGSLPDGAFVVGVVGRNQPRKRIDLSIEYFAEWVKREGIDDAYLYLHVAPTGEQGCDIGSLARYHGMRGRVIWAKPDVGVGIETERMASVYSAFDVLLSTTQGEGWGLTAMEAMACGVPCVLPDWSAYGEWAKPAALLVPCLGTALTAPLNDGPYTIGGIMDKETAILTLDRLYRGDPGEGEFTGTELRALYRRGGLELTARPEYRWENIGAALRSVLESVVVEGRRIEALSAVADGNLPTGIEPEVVVLTTSPGAPPEESTLEFAEVTA